MGDIYTCLIDTPLGKMRAAAKDEVIIGLWFEKQKYYPSENKLEEWIEVEEYRIFKVLKIWLDEYFAGKKKRHDFPLAPEGTPFQLKIWNILSQIEYGKITSYGKIAKIFTYKTMLKTAPRAVGGAVRRNPISILIPCHRVLGANESLVGYAGGIDKKQFLMELESKYNN
ncbi:MAG: methylated-DNA--[protein]-cysteine S-methyltransferase [Campylobacteraceae bacterium]|jgi:methylated-DNA-[protein]-cysteine S-methyltransferase|nr:methylated-DNA--[protein]-cysteine S-methyltransferase [Campylobacteraceae bacterium]